MDLKNREILTTPNDREAIDINIHVEDRKTTAKLRLDGKLIDTAEANCHPEDIPDLYTGANIALARVLDKEIPSWSDNMVWMNGRWVSKANTRTDKVKEPEFSLARDYTQCRERVMRVFISDEGLPTSGFKNYPPRDLTDDFDRDCHQFEITQIKSRPKVEFSLEKFYWGKIALDVSEEDHRTMLLAFLQGTKWNVRWAISGAMPLQFNSPSIWMIWCSYNNKNERFELKGEEINLKSINYSIPVIKFKPEFLIQ